MYLWIYVNALLDTDVINFQFITLVDILVIYTANFNQKLHDFQLWSDLDTL